MNQWENKLVSTHLDATDWAVVSDSCKFKPIRTANSKIFIDKEGDCSSNANRNNKLSKSLAAQRFIKTSVHEKWIELWTLLNQSYFFDLNNILFNKLQKIPRNTYTNLRHGKIAWFICLVMQIQRVVPTGISNKWWIKAYSCQNSIVCTLMPCYLYFSRGDYKEIIAILQFLP